MVLICHQCCGQDGWSWYVLRLLQHALSDVEPLDDTADRDENYLVMDHRQENVSLWVSPSASVWRLPSCSRSWTNRSPPSPFPLLSPSSLEWPSSPLACGHGARRWVLLLSPSNKESWIYSKRAHKLGWSSASNPRRSHLSSLSQMQAVALLYHRGMWDFPPAATPHFEQWTEESLMLFTDSAIVCTACWELHSTCTVKTLEPKRHRLFNGTISS